jgi:hypothetical protein
MMLLRFAMTGMTTAAKAGLGRGGRLVALLNSVIAGFMAEHLTTFVLYQPDVAADVSNLLLAAKASALPARDAR